MSTLPRTLCYIYRIGIKVCIIYLASETVLLTLNSRNIGINSKYDPLPNRTIHSLLTPAPCE
jgi:hypothetical protein